MAYKPRRVKVKPNFQEAWNEAVESTVKIKVGNFETIIKKSETKKEVFDVDFGGRLMLQIQRTGDTYQVINGVDGYGYNAREQYKNEKVIIHG